MNIHPYTLPESFSRALQNQLDEQLNAGKKLAQNILKISDHFQKKEKRTPWQGDLNYAYLAYFTPLNFLRLLSVYKEAQRVGFPNHWGRVMEIGSGSGAAQMALAELDHFQIREYQCVELERTAIQMHQELWNSAQKPFAPISWNKTAQDSRRTDTLILSYTLNELGALPDWAMNCQQLVILEPSTREEGRNLMELRSQLMNKGFSIWAPCTHQQACPLLTQSPRDWCHNRIHIQMPEWFKELETHLPMRNDTLTYSYLLAAKNAPPEQTQRARVIGDTLREKGKTRQAVCRGPEREFLSWLDREGEAQEIAHGSRIDLPADTPKHGNELRPKGPLNADDTQ